MKTLNHINDAFKESHAQNASYVFFLEVLSAKMSIVFFSMYFYESSQMYYQNIRCVIYGFS